MRFGRDVGGELAEVDPGRPTSSTENTVKYALRAANAPMAVATYTYDTLPPAEKAALPPVEAITHAFTGAGNLTIEVGPLDQVEPAAADDTVT